MEERPDDGRNIFFWVLGEEIEKNFRALARTYTRNLCLMAGLGILLAWYFGVDFREKPLSSTQWLLIAILLPLEIASMVAFLWLPTIKQRAVEREIRSQHGRNTQPNSSATVDFVEAKYRYLYLEKRALELNFVQKWAGFAGILLVPMGTTLALINFMAALAIMAFRLPNRSGMATWAMRRAEAYREWADSLFVQGR
jgi:hypothetical protein